MESKEIKSQNDIEINGNLDGSIIVGDGNHITYSNQINADKTASELAIKRLSIEYKKLREASWKYITSFTYQNLIEFLLSDTRTLGNQFHALCVFDVGIEEKGLPKSTQETCTFIRNLSSQELLQVRDYLNSKGSNHKEIEKLKRFTKTLLAYATEIEKRKIQIEKHKAIVEI